MEITRSSVSGVGTMHDCITRSGAHFRVLEEASGRRTIYVYGSADAREVAASDEELVTIDLDEDEADILANLLHSRPIPDRVAHLERRISELTGEEN